MPTSIGGFIRFAGYMISCMSTSITMALSLAPPIIVPFMLFGGFFLNSASIPVYFEWLKWLSWFLYGYESLAVNQWSNVGSISCSAHNNATGTCLFQDGPSVLSYYNFDPVS
ncbi:unnamed protein product [Notodromas monacha]|uniref:ABC-2 type transporter transmembrane domain-containing protein n=1 Tax=Notodromas monacha TaxID=399045 RepID=A0A7R9BSA6_9CRUS|nr:unnamed protein product [Notodromas monacha]CAG0919857.1 unnamed protein product [Notodromas monacha]